MPFSFLRAAKRRSAAHLGLWLWFAASAASAAALTPPTPLPLRNWYHTQWTVQQGIPTPINAITQTNDGFLWVATSNGLYRFDGERFWRYKPRSGEDLPSSIVTSLLATRDGGLWLGYSGPGVYSSFIQNGLLTNYIKAKPATPNTIRSFSQDAGGGIWAATNYGLEHFDGHEWLDVGTHYGYPYAHPDDVAADRRGNVWTSTRQGVYFFQAGQPQWQLADAEPSNEAKIATAPDGRVWMASSNGWIRSLTTADGARDANPLVFEIKSQNISFSRDGTLWIATGGHGLIQVPAQQLHPGGLPPAAAQYFAQADGLSSDLVKTVLEDREGAIWVLTNRGLDQFRRSKLTPVSLALGTTFVSLAAEADGDVLVGSESLMHVSHGAVRKLLLPPGRIECEYRDPHGMFWLGGLDGLWRLEDDHFIGYALPGDLNPTGHNVQAISMDRAGGLWVSFDRSGVYRLAQGQWTRSGNLPGLPEYPALNIQTDTDGRLWLGYTENRVVVIDGEKLTAYGRDSGLDIGNVITVYRHGEETLVGGEKGLELLRGGRFQHLHLNHDDALDGISGIVIADGGDLWMNLTRGVIHVSATELEAARLDPSRPMRYELLDYLDGVASAPEQIRPLPTAVKATDGRIYFAMRGSVVWLDPAAIPKNPVLPSVIVESVTAGRREFIAPLNIELAPNTENLEIHYTASSLLVPQRVRFRYRLEGIDEEWQDSGNRRSAFYTRLTPGDYRFRVIASNNDDNWNTLGTSVGIKVPPTFLQSLPFKALCGLLAMALLTMLYLLRLRQLTSRLRTRLQERQAERERIARALHDTLLQNVQGLLYRFQSIMEQLPSDEPRREMMAKEMDRADRVLAEGRDQILGLRGSLSNSLPLSDALNVFAQNLAELRPTPYSVTVEGDPVPLRPEIREEVQSIGFEALTNAFRHAGATRIEVEITYDRSGLSLRVRDDGVGLDENIMSAGERSGHLGLVSMRERARKIRGVFDLWSRAGSGTEVALKVAAGIAYPDPPQPRKSRWSWF